MEYILKKELVLQWRIVSDGGGDGLSKGGPLSKSESRVRGTSPVELI